MTLLNSETPILRWEDVLKRKILLKLRFTDRYSAESHIADSFQVLEVLLNN